MRLSRSSMAAGLRPGLERPPLSREDRGRLLRASLLLSVLYCGAIIVITTVIRGVLGGESYGLTLFRVGLFILAEALLLLVSYVLLLNRGRRLRRMAGISVLLSVAAASAYGLVDQAINMHETRQGAFDARDFGYNVLYGAALIFGWCSLFVAFLFSFDLIERERRIHAWREEALEAQMRALRYQVNPHFLFNTMNSAVGLMEEGAVERAQIMLLSLSNYLRTTLMLDPLSDLSLSDELALQRQYLDIERERFSDRMQLHIDVPQPLGHALVPALILQPLLENAVKHGVCTVPGAAEIALTARSAGDRLVLTVENDFRPESGTRARGAGIGLVNVRQRLEAHYPGQAELAIEPGLASRRFRVTVNLPLRGV